MLSFVVARLREPSTYAGIAAGFASASAGALNAGWQQIGGWLAMAGIGLGLVAGAVKEAKAVIGGP